MSSLKSPHVVLFFGACIKPRLCMVFEFCHKGALYDVLNSTTETIDWKRMLSICQGMGKAVNTLHNWKPTIVHRDLKSLNLLVDENFTIKVCDFGLSRFATGAANLSTLGKLRGTYAYSAPEVYFGEPFTVKADVFSVGIILWEMVYRVMVGKYAMPYSEYPRLVFDFQIIIQVAKHKLRPTIPAGCPEILADLIRSCWDQEPKKRPTMVGFMAKIDEAAKQFKDHKSEWNALIPKRDAKADVKPEVKHDAPKDGKEEVEEVKPNPLPKETLKEPDAAELAALNEGREKPKDEDVSDDSEEDSVVKPGEESSDEFDV
eukprot:TRINITY_DN6173_c0_g2_i3.p1 TRINITY_DN6173_c0_g2~~TRINITY_DN6173_c0_g2_i3.p1  ORF type:complete len:346 (-),score=25.79 TRINITY_DN6173_c0_g2_i3:111-1061(-)